MSFCASRCWVSDSTTRSKSGTPSPVIADVGTTETVAPGSSLSQYNATFNDCALSCWNASCFFASNSAVVFSAWFASASRIEAPSTAFQS